MTVRRVDRTMVKARLRPSQIQSYAVNKHFFSLKKLQELKGVSSGCDSWICWSLNPLYQHPLLEWPEAGNDGTDSDICGT